LIVNETLYGIVDVILMLTLVMICSGETLKMMKFLLLWWWSSNNDIDTYML